MKLEDYPFNKVAENAKDIEELIINVIKHELDRMVTEMNEDGEMNDDGKPCSHDDFFGFSSHNCATVGFIMSVYEQLGLDIFKGASNIWCTISSTHSLQFEWEHYNDDYELIFKADGSYYKKSKEYKNWR